MLAAVTDDLSADEECTPANDILLPTNIILTHSSADNNTDGN